MKKKYLLTAGMIGILLAFTAILTGCGFELPATPTGVKAEVVTENRSILISWNEVSGATSYYVYYGSAGRKDPVLKRSVNSTSYEDTFRLKDATYYYKVSAVNDNGEGSPSKIVSVSTPLNW